MITGDKIAEALNSAFRHTESSLETGFSQTEENAVILALGTKGDRPNWPNFLRKSKEEALDEGYVRISAEGFISTEEGDGRIFLNQMIAIVAGFAQRIRTEE